jgi:hypothetical protein
MIFYFSPNGHSIAVVDTPDMVPPLPSKLCLYVIGENNVQFANKFVFNSLFFNQTLQTINHYSGYPN